MKPTIIIGSKNVGSKNDPATISEAIKTDNKKLLYWEDLIFEIAPNHQRVYDSASGLDIAEAKLVLLFGWYKTSHKGIYKDMAYALALYLASREIEFWNGEALLQRSTTKLSAMMQLSLAGIDVPGTQFTLDTAQTLQLAKYFPCIVKAYAASRGRDNYLVHSKEELQEKLPQEGLNSFLVQECITNEYDLRIVCFDGKPKLAIKRQRTGENTHLNNTSQGGAATLIALAELPDELLTNTEKICKITQRQMAGVDWLVASDGSGRYTCLEVNAIPQLTSGTYISEKLTALNNTIIEKD